MGDYREIKKQLAKKEQNKNGIFDDNDNEIANNIAKKVTIPDENKQNKKRNNDTRF